VAAVAASAVLWLMPAAARAQGPPPAPAGAGAGSETGATTQDRWWEKSSLASEPLPEQFRFHTAAEFSFSDSRGNTSGTTVTKHAEVTVRKRRVTNRVLIDLNDTNMVYGLGGGGADYHQSTVRNHAELDLTKSSVLAGGVEYARNTLVFIDQRLTVYAGGGKTLVERHGHKVTLTGGVGYATFRFMRDEMANIDPEAVAALPTTTPASAGALLMQSWTWTSSRKLSIQQSSSAMEYIEQDLGHLITFDVSVTVPVSARLAFVPRYTLKDEDNIYIRALDVKTLDSSFGIGIRVTF
jgi:hypothetical protein